jgi:methionyl-tRNA formyltransferase
MTKNQKILIISGNLLKHKYFALEILKKFKNSALVFEKYPKNISTNYSLDKSVIIKNHFKKVIETDNKFFKNKVELYKELINKRTLISVNKGNLNSSKCLKIIVNYNPDLIILCATSLIKGDLYSLFKRKIINFHAGLCQYYRGTGCNVWAIYYNHLDKIGCTIHFIDKKLDTGNIIIQARPSINKNDNSHLVGVKVAKLGANLVIKTINFYVKNNYIPSSTQKNNKKTIICKNKDFNEKIVLKLNKLIKLGIFKQYVERKKNIKLINNLI